MSSKPPTQTSIVNKFILALLLTSASVLLLSSIGFLISDWYSLKSAAYERLKAQADIVGNSAISSIVFNDRQSAKQTLSILERESDIQAAAIFDEQMRIFVSYERGEGKLPATIPKGKSGEVGDYLYVLSKLEFEQDTVGHILIMADLSSWRSKQNSNLLTTSLVFIFSFMVALILSAKAHNIVTAPILKLAKTAREISLKKDYSLRAEKVSKDEIGRLVDDFNDMLEQIAVRDRELFKINEGLEEAVESRTQELTQLTRQLEQQAYYDSLTGLANRITFDDHLKMVIHEKERYKGQLAVLFLDLDRFKIVNDTFGHRTGDKLLIEVARRFKSCVRESDTLARLSGDEFAILVPQIESNFSAMSLARKLAETIDKPLEIDGHNLHITTSIGISIFPDDGSNAEAIVRNADTAMYRSKERGRNQVTFFSADMNTRNERRLELENKLRAAVSDNKFSIYYQPRFDVQSKKIVGIEALSRWIDDEEGEISPDEFIPLAEDCGLISRIDECVIKKACKDVLRIQQKSALDLTLAVNFSPAHFIRRDLDSLIAGILKETGFPPTQLELEVTESVFGPDNAEIYDVFYRLQSQHIKIAIDDFGTSYSSLSRLKQLPLHTLKIDKSFIRDLGKDQDDEIIVQTIISMAHNLNLHVVAEGIENELQFQFVKKYGCETVQGFLFAKPMNIDDLEQLIDQQG